LATWDPNIIRLQAKNDMVRADYDDEEEALKHVVGMSYLLQPRTGKIR
jgi:hypothetical protein